VSTTLETRVLAITVLTGRPAAGGTGDCAQTGIVNSSIARTAILEHEGTERSFRPVD
jgi:hypothetical protein